MKYRVLLSQTIIETAYVEVEADDERGAERKAIDKACSENPPLEWVFSDIADDGIEAIECEEIQQEVTNG